MYYRLHTLFSSFNENNLLDLLVLIGKEDSFYVTSQEFREIMLTLNQNKEQPGLKEILMKHSFFQSEFAAEDICAKSTFYHIINGEFLFLLKEEDFELWFDLLQDFILLKERLENQVAFLNDTIFDKDEILKKLQKHIDKKNMFGAKACLLALYLEKKKEIKNKTPLKKAFRKLKQESMEYTYQCALAEIKNLNDKILSMTTEIVDIVHFSEFVDRCILLFERLLYAKTEMQGLHLRKEIYGVNERTFKNSV